MNQIINMVMRQIVRRLVNAGINKSVDMAAKRGKAGEELTPEQKKLAGANKKRAKQSVRMARRIGRF